MCEQPCSSDLQALRLCAELMHAFTDAVQTSWRIPGELRRFAPSGISAGGATLATSGTGSDARDSKPSSGLGTPLEPSAMAMNDAAAAIEHPSPHVEVRPEPSIPPAIVVSTAASIRLPSEDDGPAARARPAKKRRRHRADEIDDLFADF